MIYIFRHTLCKTSPPFGQKIRSPPLTVRNFRFRHGTPGARRVCCFVVGDLLGKLWGLPQLKWLTWCGVSWFSQDVELDLIGFGGLKMVDFHGLLQLDIVKRWSIATFWNEQAQKSVSTVMECRHMQAEFSSFLGYSIHLTSQYWCVHFQCSYPLVI